MSSLRPRRRGYALSFGVFSLSSPVWAAQVADPSPVAAGPSSVAPSPVETPPAPRPSVESPSEAGPSAPGSASSPGAPAENPVSAGDLRALTDALGADAQAVQAGPAPAAASANGGAKPSVQAASGGSNILDLALILDVAGAWFSDDEPLQVGGHDPNHTGFTFQQLELSAGANVDPYFRFDTNIVFGLFGVEVEEAYGSTLALPGDLQVRAGQFLTRFGRLNATHPHAWSFADQPLVNGRYFGSEGSRGLGAELSWLSPLPWYVELVGSGTEAAGECCARSFYGGDDLGVDGPGDLLYTTALKQFFPFTDSASLLWGLSAQFGPNASGNGNRTEIYGTDLYFRFRPVDSSERRAFSWQTEIMHRRRQVPHDVLTDLGGYTQLVAKWSPDWETGLRAERVLPVDGDDPELENPEAKYAFAVTWYPSHFSRLRLQTSVADRGGGSDLIYGALLGLELVTGTHGAHAF